MRILKVGGGLAAGLLLWWCWPWLRPVLAPVRGAAVIAVLADDPIRTETALDLWQQRPGARLIIQTPAVLQDDARRQILDRQLPPQKLLQVSSIDEGLDTMGQVSALTRWTRGRAVGSVTLVTGEEHLPRAESIARILLGAEGIRVSGAAAPTGGFREDPWRRRRDQLRAQLWRALSWDGRLETMPWRTMVVRG